MADEHTGGMIALIPRAEDARNLAVPGGEPAEEAHLTLVYLGDDVTGWTARQRAEAVTAAGFCAADAPAIEARVFGHAMFNPDGHADRDPCAVYLVGDSRVLGPMRTLLAQFASHQQHEPFVPHITAGFGIPLSRLSFTGALTFDRLRVALGSQVVDFPLGDTEEIKNIMGELESKGKMPPGLAEKFKKKTNGRPSDDKGGTADAGINNIGDLAKAIKTYKTAKADAKPELWKKIKAAATKLKATKMLSGLEAPKASPAKQEKDVFEAAYTEYKVASPDPRAAKLREYWAHGAGRAKWRPGTPGDFMRLVRQLRKYVQNPRILKGLAANIHHMATGTWPGVNAHKDVLDWIDAGAPLEEKAELGSSALDELELARAALTKALDGDEDDELEPDYDNAISEEDAAEQALADDVTWDLNPDGTLERGEEDSSTGLDESSSMAPEEDEEIDDLFALVNRAHGAA